MRILKAVGASALIAMLGCSGETVAAPANLSGSWNFVFNTVNAEAGAACTGAMTFTISQTDQTFVGFQRGAGAVSCTGIALALAVPNPSDSTEFDNEIIGTGVVGSSEVVFTLNTLNGTNTGTVDKDMMSGRASWKIPVLPKGTLAVSGTFTATRKK